MFPRSIIVSIGLLLSACGTEALAACKEADHSGTDYTICTFNSETADIRLFLKDEAGQVLGSFDAVNAELAKADEMLIFAMNGGMYHKDRSPVGFYREAWQSSGVVHIKESPGNFGMVPNGVFFTDKGSAAIQESKQFLLKSKLPAYATQSGPMLVVDGALHPKFNEGSTSRRIRNGVGQTADGDIVFVMSEQPVNFYDFASVFKDELNAPNALYLDGVISRLYSRELDRNDMGAKMGPIVGVVVPREP